MATKTFTYEALDPSGSMRKGKIEADSPSAVTAALTAQKLITLNVSVTGNGLRKDIKIPGLGRRTTLTDLAIFARQFASMTSSGLSLLRSLAILEDQSPKPKLKAALAQMRSNVEGGMTLSSAMAQHPDQFPLLMMNMIKSGETGGFLDDALDRVARMYEADAKLRAKIKSAMTYPVIVLIFSLLMGAGVILFIVPVFEKMFRNLGGKLPAPTQFLVTLSHNMWWGAPLLVGAVVGGQRLYRVQVRRSYALRLRADQLKLKLPVFGPLFAKIAISRWARNLGTLLSVGVPIIQALEVVGGTAGNAVISESMDKVKQAVRTGQQMSGPLAKNPLFPTMVVQMLEVGEETGQITDMLDKVADFFDHEIESATESLASAIEPLMVVLLGAVIGSMVICLYLPMFSIYQHIQT
jgi:type IV pilus assembly protein PilC